MLALTSPERPFFCPECRSPVREEPCGFSCACGFGLVLELMDNTWGRVVQPREQPHAGV